MQSALYKSALVIGFNECHLRIVILAAGVKVFSNYGNYLRVTEVDAQFADYQ